MWRSLISSQIQYSHVFKDNPDCFLLTVKDVGLPRVRLHQPLISSCLNWRQNVASRSKALRKVMCSRIIICLPSTTQAFKYVSGSWAVRCEFISELDWNRLTLTNYSQSSNYYLNCSFIYTRGNKCHLCMINTIFENNICVTPHHSSCCFRSWVAVSCDAAAGWATCDLWCQVHGAWLLAVLSPPTGRGLV